MRVRGKFRELLFQLVTGALRTFRLLRSEHDGLETLSTALTEVLKNWHCNSPDERIAVRENNDCW